jgi:hypothetical protein
MDRKKRKVVSRMEKYVSGHNQVDHLVSEI